MVREVEDAWASPNGDEQSGRFGALVIPVKGDWHAMAISRVREVVARPPVTELPTASATVIGVFNLRGEIVPLFDVAALLGLGTAASHPFAVVIETTFGPAGLAASGVPEAVTLTEPMGPAETPGTSGLYAVGTRIVTLLDLDTLLEPGRVGG